MSERSHHITTTDGVTIAGRVHGQGPPLVFLQGAMGDGDLDWQALLPYMTGRFTCHLPSMRGRGLSGDHPDLSLGRVIDDFLAYVDSIGQPTGLVGWSGGAMWALAMAARSDAVEAVASCEPVANSLMDEQEKAALGQAVARAGELAGEGDLTTAMCAFAGYPFTDEDIAAAEDAGYFEAVGRYVPNVFNFFQQFREYEGPLPDDPAVLGRVFAPVLVVHGSNTKPFLAASARHVTDHVPDARIHQIPGAGHASPLTHPGPLAEVLTEFFSPAQQLA
jgi:pimeloyl-ACP methyl ester carboxylesterase